jgi:hypothetical protein
VGYGSGETIENGPLSYGNTVYRYIAVWFLVYVCVTYGEVGQAVAFGVIALWRVELASGNLGNPGEDIEPASLQDFQSARGSRRRRT